MRTRLLTVGNAMRLALCDPMTLIERARTAAELRRLRTRSWPPADHPVEPHWYEAVHGMTGTDLPCDAGAEFGDVWSTVKTAMDTDGERIAEKFDADVNLSRALWCTVRHTIPERVVETGVARGAASWIILEALARNETGHLWSIDLPNLAWAFDAGQAIPDALRTRWTYLRGASSRLLPRLVDELGGIGLFVHDSLHTEGNVRFELETAWPAVTDGGLIFVDDVDDSTAYGAGSAFSSFIRSRTPGHFVVAPQDQKRGCFGVMAKTSS